MITLSLSQTATIVGGHYQGNEQSFIGVSIDSRLTAPGELFVAILGEHHNGHDFLSQAKQRGAVAAIIDSAVTTDLPTIRVDNTLTALTKLAHYWRQHFPISLVAVTGSNGKTTTRTMISRILQTVSSYDEVLLPEANFNTLIGVPLTLFKLNPKHRYAVIEMGMNQFGEIEQLTQLCKPQVGVITNAGPAHLEHLGNIENVASAKGELFANLPPEAVGIVNLDDPFADKWLETLGDRQHISFGLNNPRAAVNTSWQPQISHEHNRFNLSYQGHSVDVDLTLPGKHNVHNALAAASACLALGVSLDVIAEGLGSMQAVKQRLNFFTGPCGACLIDDTYNANPNSVNAALEVLAATAGKKIWIFGDMAELGDSSPELHADLGRLANSQRIDVLLTVGKLSRYTHEAFQGEKHHLPDKATLVAKLLALLDENTTVLIKGSRFMRMEEVTQALLQKNNVGEC